MTITFVVSICRVGVTLLQKCTLYNSSATMENKNSISFEKYFVKSIYNTFLVITLISRNFCSMCIEKRNDKVSFEKKFVKSFPA